MFREIIDNVIATIKQQNLLFLTMRKLSLHLIYAFCAKHFAKRFVISFIIFDLCAKYSEIALRHIYNNLNIKDRIMTLIRKRKLKKFFVKIALKN